MRNAILALETSIAKITIPQADMRDPVATYHKMSLADFQTMTPHLNWTRYLQQHRANVRRRRERARAELLQGARLAASPRRPSTTGRRISAGTSTSGAMGSLSSPFRNEAFRWQQVTSGVQAAGARAANSARPARTARSAKRSARTGSSATSRPRPRRARPRWSTTSFRRCATESTDSIG